MSYQLKENRIMQLDPRIIMHIPADEPFYDRQLRAENIEDIWLHKSGGQHLVFLTENEIAYLPNENGGAKLDHGSGGEVLLRAA
ncbi:hypothetical protein [Croceicoccus sp. Ery15]|uniref:hypothetical protein n=1 Tax=Croceicoccus sp. Ery15 TaxID=1703338 RepID=UPI001E3FCC1A|nr:hypothetical protein [Croceicoccus sp. Ery15]